MKYWHQLINKGGSQGIPFQSVLKFLEGKQLQGFPFMQVSMNVDPNMAGGAALPWVLWHYDCERSFEARRRLRAIVRTKSVSETE